MRNNNLESVQVIRAIAALLVLLYHGSALVNMRFGYNLEDYFWWGYSGVDIFFVLSGFIIVYSTLLQPNLLSWEFLLRRLVRIYPLYWLAIAFVVGLSSVGQLFNVSADSSVVEAVSKASMTSLLGTLFLVPKSSEIIKVAWTLSYEMMFYLLFAYFFFKNKKQFFCIMFAWALVSLITAFGFHADYSGTTNPIIALLNPIMIEFLLGCVAAYYFYQIKPIFLIKLLVAFLVLINVISLAETIGAMELKDIPTNNQYFRFLNYGGPAFSIILGMLYWPIKYPKFLTSLGDASYSIYLFHYPVMGILAKLLLMAGLHHFNLLSFVFLMSLTTIMCCLIYFIAEKPILNYGKREIKKLKYELSYAGN